MLIRNVDHRGQRMDCRLSDTRIDALAPAISRAGGEPVLEAAGGALLPALHDHHLHFASLAAAAASVDCGPREVSDARAMAERLRNARPDAAGWVRAIGYHEQIAGWPDRATLDDWQPAHPLRLQHRGGAWWLLNSAGLAALGLEGVLPAEAPEGAERDAAGRSTGRFRRCDRWLRDRGLPATRPDFAAASRLLASRGVASFTDATPDNDAAQWEHFASLRSRGVLQQEIRMMGDASLNGALPAHAGMRIGAAKLMLDEDALPALEACAHVVASAHGAGREVAFHCVTRTELAFAMTVLAQAGSRPGDRLEHASVAPDDWLPRLAAAGVTVVTQPGFVHVRGDDYLRDVEEADRPWLYRGAAFLGAGIALAAGSDAPFGPPDPWRAMATAVDRRTRAGAVLGASEALSPERALGLFTGTADAPGARPRTLHAGAAASLCLLDRSWRDARRDLGAVRVRATWSSGRLIWSDQGLAGSAADEAAPR